MSYQQFLANKTRTTPSHGHPITDDDVHPMLHPWQRRIVTWAVAKGRAALWEATGSGKTFQAIEWARNSVGPDGRALIVGPLAVCQQTVREAAKLGVKTAYIRSDTDAAGPGLWVTNYEMIDHFGPARFDAMVLDESSCLKQSDGKLRTKLIHHFASVPRRLACSATPAPNDIEELTNQAEFLGVTTRVEMLAAYFVHDQDGWRVKGHAKGPMFRWMASWAVALNKPSDIGGDDTGYNLPGLDIIPHLLPVDVVPEGQLFATDLGGVGGRAKIRRATLDARVDAAVKLVVNEPDEPWLLWCGLNDEARALARALPGAVNVEGNWTPEDKAQAIIDFADGKIRTFIIKPSIASLGINWQHCARAIFVGLSDSMEQYYQAIRRCYRYGQTRVVRVHIVLSELEGAIAQNVARKEREHDETSTALIREMRAAGELTL